MKQLFKAVSISYLLLLPLWSVAQKQKIFVMEIRDNIDPRMNRYVKLALESASAQGVDAVLIDMDTYGGAVNDADAIRSAILEFNKPVYVFINRNAASAGALISIACDSIYMENGANIGAATVVSGADGSQAPDKYQSYMRSIMRSTAEAKNRNPRIAEAMVDANIEIEGISEKGQVITFTASEAMKNGFCEGIASSKEEVLKLIGITDYELLPYQLSTIEEIISLFLNPLVSSLLILIMIGGIYFELQTPGVGFPIIAAITAALLYFTPYYLNGLAEYWEILVFIVGIGLIMVEIFVLPGFGIAGISGIILVIGSLVLVMVENDAFDFTLVDMGNLKQAIVATLGGTLGAVAVIFWGISRVGNSGLFKKVALQDTLQKEAGYTSSFLRNDLIGLTGTAHTILRPSGKVNIDDQIYDAYTRGEYIEKGEEIVVISDEGTSLKVKKVKDGL